MNQWEVEWSQNHFKLLKLNAVWGVPRSGLVFKKVSTSELALDRLMPWTPNMGRGFLWGYDLPPSQEDLLKCQRADFECIAMRFEAAGINTTDPKGLLKT